MSSLRDKLRGWRARRGERQEDADTFSKARRNVALFGALGTALIPFGAANAVGPGSPPSSAVAFVATGTSAARSPADRAADTVSVKDFGALGDGVTDDLPAFNAALATGAISIRVPSVTTAGYRLSAGITLPGTTTLWGDPHSDGSGVAGTVLLFDATVATCVTLNGGGGNAAQGLRRLTVARAGGSPPALSIGIYVTSAYNVVLEDVMSLNHARCFRFFASGALGLSTMMTRCYTALATDVHFEIDSWPELRLSQCRFGRNGAGDYTCNAYVRIMGGQANPATNPGIGPNTIEFNNCQFNQGANQAARWVTFDGMLGGGFTASIFTFNHCHVEAAVNGIGSNSGTGLIYNLMLTNVSHNVSGNLFVLDPATSISQVALLGCVVDGGLTLAPTAGINALKMTACNIAGAVSITGAGASTCDINACTFQSSLTLAGPWVALNVQGGTVASLACTATGSVNVNVPPNWNFRRTAVSRGTLGRNAWASGNFAVQGDAQATDMVMRGTTVGIAGTNLTTDGNSPIANNIITLAPKVSATLRFTIICRQIGGTAGTVGDSASWDFIGLVKMEATAATAVLVSGGGGSTGPNLTSAGLTGQVTVSTPADTTNGGILVQCFCSVANKNLEWVCRVASVEAAG